MEKHIKHILQEVNTIIIPGLGALTVTSQKTGEIMYMPYLKYDDGKLASFVATQENCSLDDAKIAISKYVQVILDTLESSKVFNMNKIGVFSKDAAGDIDFKSGNSEIPSVTPVVAIEMPSIEIEVEAETEVETKILEVETDSIIEQEPKTEALEIEDADEDKTETKALEVEVKGEERLIEPSHEQTVIEEKVIEIEEEIKKEDDFDEEAFLAEDEVPAKKKKSKVFKVLMLFLLLSLLGGGTFIGLNFDKFKGMLPFGTKGHTSETSEEKMIKNLESDETKPTKEKASKTEELVVSPSTEETTEKQEEAPVTTPEPIAAPTPISEPVVEKVHKNLAKKTVRKTNKKVDFTHNASGNSFHIILGTFSENVNATNMMENLKDDGYSSASVIERDGKFSVSLDAFGSKEEAIANLEKAKTVFTKVWVFQK